MNKTNILYFTLFFISFTKINAQKNITDTQQAPKYHKHENNRNEIGLANSPVFLLNEKNLCYGFHIHYIKNINHSKFGIGLGYERIFDEHKHNTFGIVASYELIDKLTFNISPGLMLEDENLKKANLAIHFETAYEFKIKYICIGPVFETAFDAKDIHMSIGLHLGIDF